MKTIHLRFKRITKLGLLLMMGASMSACSSTMQWKEEVKLHDGQVIMEERYVNLGGYPYLSSTERISLDETATFTVARYKQEDCLENGFP